MSATKAKAKALPSGSAITIANGIVFAVGNGDGKNNTINKTLVYMTQGCWVRAISQSNDQQNYQRGTIMKFVNNNAISTANRRAAAMGLSLAALTAAICKVSEAAKAAVDRTSFGFSEGYLPSKTISEMAQTISEIIGYGGGYLYSGGYASVLQYPEVRFDHLCHWSKDYDRRDPSSFIAANFGRLQRLIEGSTLRLGYSGQYSSHEEWVLKDDMWVHTVSYCGMSARWEEERFQRETYLFSGIRAAVAKELEVEADYGFHRMFDEAIISLDE